MKEVMSMAAHFETASWLGSNMANVGRGSEFMKSRRAVRNVAMVLLFLVAALADDVGCGGEVINGER